MSIQKFQYSLIQSMIKITKLNQDKTIFVLMLNNAHVFILLKLNIPQTSNNLKCRNYTFNLI